jgi:hypothetical protein
VAPTTIAVTSAAPVTVPPTVVTTTTVPAVAYDLGLAVDCRVGETLRVGSSGVDVACLEQRLSGVTSHGIGFVVDDHFGEDTDAAVRQFQTAHALTVDGIVGAQTTQLLGIWTPPIVQPAVDVPPAPQPSAGSVHFANCDAARAAGAAPVRRGDPGYRAGLDRDGDGIGCE